MPFQSKVKYGEGFRVLDCTNMNRGEIVGAGADIAFLIERPDGELLRTTVHCKHVPYREFYDKAQRWLEVELNAKRYTIESIPDVWDADLMNKAEN